MPYFDHHMATSIADKDVDKTGNDGARPDKVIRTVPANNQHADTAPNEAITARYNKARAMDLRKLMALRGVLKAAIERMHSQTGAVRIKDAKKAYDKFTVERDKVLVKGDDSTLLAAKHADYPSQPLTCRVYGRKVAIGPDAMYLKYLRHLGRKHQSIVQTWDIFVDERANIEIFQEYCEGGNLADFAQEPLKEPQMVQIAWQVLRGMDYLGDIGIAHRCIHPRNIVLRPTSKREPITLLAKLCNFRHSVIYWSVEENDIIYQPCLPAARQAKDGANCQAPEVYGDPKREEFDPIIADTFSYGAVIYSMATGQYPYNQTKLSTDVDKEIQGNLKKVSSLSKAGKDLLGQLLRAVAGERIPFGLIEKSPWFGQARKADDVKQQLAADGSKVFANPLESIASGLKSAGAAKSVANMLQAPTCLRSPSSTGSGRTKKKTRNSSKPKSGGRISKAKSASGAGKKKKVKSVTGGGKAKQAKPKSKSKPKSRK